MLFAVEKMEEEKRERETGSDGRVEGADVGMRRGRRVREPGWRRETSRREPVGRPDERIKRGLVDRNGNDKS